MLSRVAAFFRRIRVSGVNVGIPGVGGVSVGLAEPERKAIRDLLVFLEGRRVLRVSYADEDREFVVSSVLEIREELTRTLQRLPESSPATESVRQLRRACEEFLTVYARDAFWVGFFVGLGRLRGLFGSELERLGEVTGLKLPHELKEVGPPKTDFPDDAAFDVLRPPWEIDPPEQSPETIRKSWEQERRLKEEEQ
jgi:hypothetical protein